MNIILKNEGLLPIEVKETVNEADIVKFSKLVEYVNAKRGIMVSLNRGAGGGNIEVIPAYTLESQLTKLGGQPSGCRHHFRSNHES